MSTVRIKKRLLIIGGGMASAYLLQQLDRYDHEFGITVVCSEDHALYNRVLLSSLLAGDKSVDDLTMLSDAMLSHIRIKCETLIEAIDLDRKVATTQDGEHVYFDTLVFATGANVAVPETYQTLMQDIEGFVAFRSLSDAQRCLESETPAAHAVVIGGGLLGLEAAYGLTCQGVPTTVVHRNAYLMNRQLDEAGAKVLQQELESMGIGMRTSSNLLEVQHADGRITGVVLDDGSALPCDQLVFATGITPCTELARASGLGVERGICVNALLETNMPNVYALGECCEFEDNCFGLVAPIQAQAEVLAATLAGAPTAGFELADYPTQLKISGIEIFSAGDIASQRSSVVMTSPSEGIYRRLILDEDKLVGVVLVGNKRHGQWYSGLIEQRKDISEWRKTLMFGPTNEETGDKAA